MWTTPVSVWTTPEYNTKYLAPRLALSYYYYRELSFDVRFFSSSLQMLRSITNVRVHFRRNYGCYEPLRMLRSLLCKCYVLTLLTYRCYVVLQHISDMLRLYNKCYDRVRQLIRCYEHLRMLRYFSLQLLRCNAPLLQMLRFS